MEIRRGDILWGFRVERVRENAELQGRMVEMVHTVTGTPLCWLDNEVENKVFSLTVPTFPEDDSGVFHILEHSTLCGSEKYPVREPFVELMKGSMSTFLNAMTFPDKTMYPVASRNDKDFLNLTSVYLDAVFAPRFLQDPNIFYQEGWHLELGEDAPSFKGVVLNEMKGAMSQVDDVMDRGLFHDLFPDTPYGFQSGGLPESITDLSYEQFVESYRKFYHPSKCMIYLDGAVPLEETLRLIDSYLSRFGASGDRGSIAVQTPRASSREIFYELGKDEPMEDRNHFAAGSIVCSWRDHLKIRAIQLLLITVAVSNDAPLIRPILDKGIAKSLDIALSDGILQPYLSISAKQVTSGREDEILPVIRSAAAELVKNGIDRAEMEATLNLMEFKNRERSEPQGISRAVKIMETWLYGGDPMELLLVDADYRALRDMLKTSAYEDLVRELFLEEKPWTVLKVHPDPDLGRKNRDREQEKIRWMLNAMTEDEVQELRTMNERLLHWQQTVDTPEQLATIPHLRLSDLGDLAPFPVTDTEFTDGVRVMKHHIATNGITYVNMYFRLSDLPYEDIPLLELLINEYTSLPTDHYDALTLQREIRSILGKVDTRLAGFDLPESRDKVNVCFCVSFSTLERNLDKAEDMVLELLFHTRFDQKDRLLELLHQDVDAADRAVVSSGFIPAMRTVLSSYSSRAAFLSARDGVPYLKYIHDLLNHFDEKYTEFERMNRWLTSRIGRRRMVLSAASTNLPDMARLIAKLPKGTESPEYAVYTSEYSDKTAIRVPAQVSLTLRGWNMGEDGFHYDGGMEVMDQIVSLSYLWNVVRVQGGAYGTAQRTTDMDDIFLYSYRDPTPEKSLEAFRHVGDFLRSFADGDESLEGFIISTVNSTDPMTSPSVKASEADIRYFLNRNWDMLQQIREEMLRTDRKKLLEYAEIMDRFAEESRVCIVGNEDIVGNLEGFEVVDIR